MERSVIPMDQAGRGASEAKEGAAPGSAQLDFRTETLSVLKTIGDAVPAGIRWDSSLKIRFARDSPLEREGFSDNLPKDEDFCGFPDPISWLRVSLACILRKQKTVASPAQAGDDAPARVMTPAGR